MILNHFLAKQFHKPQGLLGYLVSNQFKKSNQNQNDWVIPLLDIKSTDHVLEIGFGNGDSIKKISQLTKAGLVTGIDHSEIMLEKAKLLNEPEIISGLVELKFGEVPPLPYHDDAFDKILAVYVVYFWKNPLVVLKEINRVLKPGGLTAIYLSTKETLKNKPFTQTGIFKDYDPGELIALFVQAGFKEIKHLERKFNEETGMCILGKK